MKKVLTLILICLTTCSILQAQGVFSQYADPSGNYARFGPISNALSPRSNLYFSGDKIETYSPILASPAPIRPTLRLNPASGHVTIGAVPSNSDVATLSILSMNEQDNPPDLRLMGHGRIGTQGSMYIHLDDNNTADEYFSIKGSGWEDLFFVGENGNNFLKGNLRLEGGLRLEGDLEVTGTIINTKPPETEIVTIGFSDFEVMDDGGAELYIGPEGFVRNDGNSNDFGRLASAVNLPHGSTITKLEVIYFDNHDNGQIHVGLESVANTSNDITFEFSWYSSFQGESLVWQVGSFANLGIKVDNQERVYFVQLWSEEWSSMGIRQIKLHYTR